MNVVNIIYKTYFFYTLYIYKMYKKKYLKYKQKYLNFKKMKGGADTIETLKIFSSEQLCTFNWNNAIKYLNTMIGQLQKILKDTEFEITIGNEREVNDVMFAIIKKNDRGKHTIILDTFDIGIPGKFNDFWNNETFNWKDDADLSKGTKVGIFAASGDVYQNISPIQNIKILGLDLDYRNDDSKIAINSLEFISTVQKSNYKIDTNYIKYLKLYYTKELILSLKERGLKPLSVNITNVDRTNYNAPCLVLNPLKGETNYYLFFGIKQLISNRIHISNEKKVICEKIFKSILNTYTPQLTFGVQQGCLGSLIMDFYKLDEDKDEDEYEDEYEDGNELEIVKNIYDFCYDKIQFLKNQLSIGDDNFTLDQIGINIDNYNILKIDINILKDTLFALLYFRIVTICNNYKFLYFEEGEYYKSRIIYFPKMGNMKLLTNININFWKFIFKNYLNIYNLSWVNKIYWENINNFLETKVDGDTVVGKKKILYDIYANVELTPKQKSIFFIDSTLKDDLLDTDSDLQYDDENIDFLVDFLLNDNYYYGFFEEIHKCKIPTNRGHHISIQCRIANGHDMWKKNNWILEKRNIDILYDENNFIWEKLMELQPQKRKRLQQLEGVFNKKPNLKKRNRQMEDNNYDFDSDFDFDFDSDFDFDFDSDSDS